VSKPVHELLLLADFVAAFSVCVGWEYGSELGQVVPVRTSPEALRDLRAVLPAPLPPLYERLILTYRWPESDLGEFRLLANPVGPRLTGLLEEMKRDSVLWDELIPRGWIRFGKGAGLNYDPVCFDIRRRRRDGDYRIVQLDHEEILCHSRIKEVAELALSFRELVEKTVRKAEFADGVRARSQ
jgi:hypothetical protein